MAGASRLVGKVDQARDLFDVAAFDVEASDVLGTAVVLFSDRVLVKPNVSADYRTGGLGIFDSTVSMTSSAAASRS